MAGGLVLTLLVATGVAPPPRTGVALVAADHELASQAGAEVLEAGGNAVDAAVAAALSAGVVQPAGSGLGGGGFAVVVSGGERVVWDFREVAPARATRDMFVEAEAAAPSREGPLAVAVPGESRGLAALLAQHGTLSPKVVARPAIRQASVGFPIGAHLGRALKGTRHPEVIALFTRGGALPDVGQQVRRPALAATLGRWARSAGEDLHTGKGAASLVAAVAPTGLTAEDLAAYEPKKREPLVGQYGEYTVITMPPPSSGGVVLLQALRALEGFELEPLGHNSSDYVHLVVEVLKHGFADRAHHMGDPDFVDVPVGDLIADERIRAIRGAVWPGRTFAPDHYGPLIAPPTDGGTQHISVVDRNGMAVALTTTINTSFGSGVVAEEAGIVLNNEMDDFAAAPGVPNAFGLVGSEANAVAAKKRPLSSMTPTVVLDSEGRVVFAVGASGGSFIISSVLQTLLNAVHFGMDPQEAVAAPRFHHQWQPDKLFLEPGFPLDVHRALAARGHTIEVMNGFSSVQIVAAGEPMSAGSDPRKGGWPAGVY